MNQDTKTVKISDVVENQIPEFISTENPNLVEFLKQYYVSQEYQGAPIDLAENLTDYKNIDSFDTLNLIESTNLTQEISFFDDTINVTSTNGWPSQYGLLKIDDEIITYTGITTNSFTGCIRGFSGVETLSDVERPEYLKFTSTETSEHVNNSTVYNLSNLFLKEFFRKIKYQFSPGFEEFDFDSRINAPNFISKVRSFYQTKGTDEAFKILFKVLYGKNVEVIKPRDFLFTTSDDQWIVSERFVGEAISGNPLNLNGQTLYQDESNTTSFASGSIYKISSATLLGNQYYNIDIFSGYSNNLNPKGSIFGEFNITPKTYCNLDVSALSTTIPAVSTIGFPISGTLNIGNLVITYTDKTNTEFLNCQGVIENIISSTPIYGENFVYSYEDGNSEKIVKIRLLNTLSDIDKTNTILAYKNDLLKINNIGQTQENIFTKSLIYNVPSVIFAGQVYDDIPSEKFGISKNTGKVITEYPHYLKNGDVLEVYSVTTNQKLYDGVVSNVTTETGNQFTISGSSNLTLNHIIKLKRKVFRTSSAQYPEINNKFSTNIQNSYEDSENYYLTSNGFARGNINPLKRQYQFNTEVPSNGISTSLLGQHNFYDGEIVKIVGYTVTNVPNTPGFRNYVGIYTGISAFVKKTEFNEIKLAFTKQDILNENYINFAETISDVDDTTSGYIDGVELVLSKLYENEFTTTKIFKKFPKKVEFSSKKTPTRLGSIGMFANGLEIQNVKSFDRLYDGEIVSVDVLEKGKGYNLENPPQFNVNLGIDTTTILTPELSGELESILVVDPGFDYIETPIVTINGGGNGSIRTEVKMRKIAKEIDFNAEDSNVVVTTDPINKFVFNEPHRLFPGDSLIYETFGNTAIGNLQNNGVYYIFDVGAGTSFKLASSREDALSGIGTININPGGKGLQRFTSTKLVNIIDSINVIDIDKKLKYRKIPLHKQNINHYDQIIEFENHGFVSGDEVEYSYSGSPILGTSQYYYVIKLDENRFKLSSTKDLSTPATFTESSLNDIHYISYSQIRVNIKGQLSVLGVSEIGVPAQAYPIATGAIEKIYVARSSEYGSKILNFENPPRIDVKKGKNASIRPIISNGKIIDVIVFNSGENYYNSISIDVIGSGTGAILHPVVTNGQITDVKVISTGIGYDQYTQIRIKSKGSGAVFKSNINYFTLNETSKYSQNELNRGILIGQNYYEDKNNMGVYTLTPTLKSEFEIESGKHSKIIGWAYDGCPIYGPYAYKNVDGSGSIVEMKSSYKKVRLSPIIPNSTNLDCIEDYVYEKNYGTLDEFNGRYCITPEYPNGVYAYFATSSFPYFIGSNYKYSPNNDNFALDHNQDLDFNKLGIIKHTFPYYVEDKKNYYDYFDFYPNNYKEDIIILDALDGTVDGIEVVSPGIGYSIGDKITFNNQGTGGFGASAEISELIGVGISSISASTITYPNVVFIQRDQEIVGISTVQLDLKDDYYVNISNISNSEYSKLEGDKKIKFKDLSTKLKEPLPANTGIVTSIKVTDSILNFDIDSKIRINDQIVTVVGLDYLNNSISILRDDESLTAFAQSTVDLLENKFTFKESKKFKVTPKNESYYFDSNLISVGTDPGPGLGNLITKYPLGVGVSQSKYVGFGGIWLPNHKFKHGDKVIYTIDPSSISIIAQNTSGLTNLEDVSELYVVDLGNDVIGLVDDKSKISSPEELLYFVDPGAGPLHKLTTDRNVVTGTIKFNESTVFTEESHGLSVGDTIKLSVLSGLTTEYSVTYDSSTAKLKVDGENNPELLVYRNQIVEFDLSSISSSSFKLYVDDNFENEYLGNDSSGLEVTKTSDKLILTISEYTPEKLYYNIETSDLVFRDLSVRNSNSIQINPSKFNAISGISTTTEDSFTINLSDDPESIAYINGEDSILSYTVIDSNVTGPISNIRFLFNGENYEKLPTIDNIEGLGKNAVLVPTTKTIGKINKIDRISNSIYPTDTTLKPVSNLYSVLYLTDNYKVSNIDLKFGGYNYLSPPTLKIYNSNENKVYDSVSAYCELNGSSVGNIVIADSGSGLPKNGNKVIFTENSNGVKVLESYSTESSPGTHLVSLRIETPVSGFTTSSPVPFKLGDEIYVEGIVSLGGGFNSSDYSYNTFTVVGIVSSYSSPDQTIIRYEVPKDPGTPVSYDLAYVINSRDMPICELTVSESEFFSDELVADSSLINNFIDDTNKSPIKIYDSSNLKLNQIISGQSSRSKGTISKIDVVQSEFIVSSSREKSIGPARKQGHLSEIVQKLPDNDYYQNFAYSLKSTEQISSWDSPVSDLVHVAGLKKFSDLIVESTDPSDHQVTSSDNSTINILINSYVDVSTINYFDLVLEDVDDHSNLYSEILTFKTQKLSDYLLALNNRVLSIDDISSNFDNNSQFAKFIIDAQSTISSGSVIAKYFIFLESTRSLFTDYELPSLSEVFLSKKGSGINLTSYAYFEDIPLGVYISEINPSNEDEILLEFIPINITNILSASVIKEIVPLDQPQTIIEYGNCSNVAITTSFSAEAVPTEKTINICNLNDCKSGTGYIGISTTFGNIEEFMEFTFLYNGQNVNYVEYARGENTDLGQVGISTGLSNNINITYTPVANVDTYLYINLNLLVNTPGITTSIELDNGRLNSSNIQFTASTLDPVGITTITKDYGASKYVIEVEKTVGVTTERSIIQINSTHYDIVTVQEKYLNNVNYGIIGNEYDLSFSTIFDPNQGTYSLVYYPNELADYNIKFYEKNILRATNPLL